MRRGFTLVELVVTLCIAGVTFGAFTAVVAQQERAHARLAHRIRARAQAAEGLATLAIELRGSSPARGDLVVAQDSAVELRVAVASLSVCELRDRDIVTALASAVSTPKIGDTLWALAVGDSSEWLPLLVAAVAAMAAGDSVGCVAPATAAGSTPRGLPSRQRYVLSLGQPPPESIGQGTPLRLTRRVRYSLYRAPDGQWYLGRREWSAALGRFETIQPVSGPYAAHGAAGSGTSGFELRYFDAGGEEIHPAGLATTQIARIDVTARTRPPPFDASIRGRRDVRSVTIAPRNLP